MANKEKKLQRLKASPHGWTHDVLGRLVESYGFEFRGGAKHGIMLTLTMKPTS